MLIRLTNRCTMGCSHCMIDASGPKGEHMSLEVFERALRISRLIGKAAVIVSGGEPFEHPRVFEAIRMAQERFPIVMVASNGLFALDPGLRQHAVATGVRVQIINDPLYYPRNLGLVRHLFDQPNWFFEDRLGGGVYPCRRTRESGIRATRQSPHCFNLRSLTRSFDLISAVSVLQLKGKLCTPSVNVNGDIVAGEVDTCLRIGTVDSTEAELDEALRTMRCDGCGLRDNLGPQHLAAIGEKLRKRAS